MVKTAIMIVFRDGKHLAYPDATNIETRVAGNRTRTGGRRGGGLLVDHAVWLPDLAVRQNLLQFGDARVGYLGVDEIELLQVG